MIDATVLNTAKKLKKEMDAAYAVFRKEPTMENASGWNATTKAFNNFCIQTIKDLIEAEEDSTDKTEEILANIEEYQKCTQCDAELLYSTSANSFVASSDFVEDFPGWCYPCLVEHCIATDCESCDITSQPSELCSFKEIKKIHMQNN